MRVGLHSGRRYTFYGRHHCAGLTAHPAGSLQRCRGHVKRRVQADIGLGGKLLAFIAGICVVAGVACSSRQASPAQRPVAAAPPSVFTDSTLHDKLCEPIKQDEDWRRVCVPKDQSSIIRVKPQPPRP
jgi:hypothetical protein